MTNKSIYKKLKYIIMMFLTVGVIFGLALTATTARANGVDKSDLLTNKSVTVKQNDSEIESGGELDLTKDFNVELNFDYPIIKNDYLEILELDASQQIDEGDYALIDLGTNVKYADEVATDLPVYLVDTGQYIGSMSLEYDKATEKTTARIDFKSNPQDPKGQFNYEPDVNAMQTVSVYFGGNFKATKTETSESEPGKDVIQILDKEFPIPVVEDKDEVIFKKDGVQKSLDEIEWKIEVERQINKSAADLEGFVVSDDLSSVGEYVPDSFKIDNKPVEDSQVYDSKANTLSYSFPSESTGKHVITFNTKIDWANGESSKKIANSAKITSPDNDETSTEKEVTASRVPPIAKQFENIEVQPNGNNAINWVIEVGKEGFNYGPAWIADVLSKKTDAQGVEKPIKATYHVEKKVGDSWVDVELIDDLTSPDRPKLFTGEGTGCPQIPERYTTDSMYYFGESFQEPQGEIKDGYSKLADDWFFLKELDGVYKISVTHEYDKSTSIGEEALMNDAEVHICGAYNSPIKPPIFVGAANITKNANRTEGDFIRQGIMPWTVNVDFSGAFPSDPQYAYEFFYYYDKGTYTNQKDGLTIKETLPDGTLDKLKTDPYVNYNLAYVDDSFDAGTSGLTSHIIPVFFDGEQVGEILQVGGFAAGKSYSFNLKTQRQDFVKMGASSGKIQTGDTKNTVGLFTGEGENLQVRDASDYYEITGDLLRKTAIAFDVDTKNMNDVSQSDSDSYTRFYTGTKEVDTKKIFNHVDRSVYFRIDVNPMGIDFPEYMNSVKSNYYKNMDFTNLVISDQLPEGWELVPLDEKGSYFYLYEANPARVFYIDYSITYKDSAKFDTRVLDARAKKLLSEDEANSIVSFNKAAQTWTFQNYNQKPYMILIKAKLSDEAFKDLIEGDKQNGESQTYTNNVNLNAGDNFNAKTKKDFSIKPLMLQKNEPIWSDGNLPGETNALWTITYQPFNEGEYQNVELIDTLDENLSVVLNEQGKLDLSQITVKRSNTLRPDGTYDFDNGEEVVVADKMTDKTVGVRYDGTKHALCFALPNTPDSTAPYAYQISYNTSLVPANIDAETLRNTVQLRANDKDYEALGEVEYELKNSTAWAKLKSFPFYVVQKYNKEDETEIVPGASFGLYKDNTLLSTKVSNNKGQLYLFGLEDGTYQLKELQAPEGYELLNNGISLTIRDGKLTSVSSDIEGVEGKGTLNDPIMVPNEPAEPDEPDNPDDPDPDKPDKPKDPDKPDNPQDPDEPKKDKPEPKKPVDSKKDTKTNSKSEVPKTSDTLIPYLNYALGIGGILFLIGGVCVRKSYK